VLNIFQLWWEGAWRTWCPTHYDCFFVGIVAVCFWLWDEGTSHSYYFLVMGWKGDELPNYTS